MPPWEVDAVAPDIWMERRALWADARARRWSKPRSAVGEVRQVGTKRVKRLI